MPFKTKPYLFLGLGSSLRNVEYTIDDVGSQDRRLRETGIRTVRASLPLADASATRVPEDSLLARGIRKAVGIGDVQVAGANFSHLCRNVPDVNAFIAAIEGTHPSVQASDPAKSGAAAAAPEPSTGASGSGRFGELIASFVGGGLGITLCVVAIASGVDSTELGARVWRTAGVAALIYFGGGLFGMWLSGFLTGLKNWIRGGVFDKGGDETNSVVTLLGAPAWFLLWGLAACWQLWTDGHNCPVAIALGLVGSIGMGLAWFLDDLSGDATAIGEVSVGDGESREAGHFVGSWTAASVNRFSRVPGEVTSQQFRQLGDDFLSQNALRFVLFKNSLARVRGGGQNWRGRWWLPQRAEVVTEQPRT